MGIYLSVAGILGCVAWVWDCSLPRTPSQFLSSTQECGITHSTTTASPHHTASPHLSAHLHISTYPTHLDECGFFKSLVVRLSYSSIFWWFWVLFVLKSSCNSFCGCTRRQSIFTYDSILTGSLYNIFLTSYLPTYLIIECYFSSSNISMEWFGNLL